MAVVTLVELADLMIMVAAVGYIFKDAFQKPLESGYDPLAHFSKNLNWENIRYAALAAAPGIVLHEAAHKIVALSFGLQAVFHAHLPFLLLGILLKTLNFGFIFFIPGYVSISGITTPAHGAAIAFAGPATNLLLFLLSWLALRNNLLPRHRHLLTITKHINLFLFAFNMLPLPPFDGSTVFSNLFRTFF